jgi:hypothetical protein
VEIRLRLFLLHSCALVKPQVRAGL